MPKGTSGSRPLDVEQEFDVLEKRQNIFYFLEGLGTLLWVLGDFSWILEIEVAFTVMYAVAVAANLSALGYAFFKLRGTIPLIPVIGYNLWVSMGCLWAFSEVRESDLILYIARGIGALMLIVTIWEFALNRNNKENIVNFTRSFRRFRIREEISGLKISDIRLLPENLRSLFQWMLRQEEVGLAEVKAFLKLDDSATRKTMGFLVKRGFVKEIKTGENISYAMRLAPWKGPEVPLRLWEALTDKVGKPGNPRNV